MTKEELLSENKELKRKLFEAKADAISNAYFAIPTIKKLGKEYMLGSSVIVHLSVLGNSKIIDPFSISDGLSKNLINALIEDIKRDFKHKTSYTPDGFKELPEFE